MLQLDVDVSPRLKKQIETADALKEEIKKIPINNFTERLLYNKMLVASVFYSLSLSGIHIYKDDVAQFVLQKPHTIKKHKEALASYVRIVEYIHSYYNTSSLGINKESLLNVHEHILDYDKNIRLHASFRDYDSIVDNTYVPCKFSSISQEISALCTFMDTSTLHPLLKVGIFYINFLRIHPFQAGNNRTACAMSLLYLYQSGYSCSGMFSHERYLYFPNGKKFNMLLAKGLGESYTDTTDIGSFLSFYLDSIQQELLHILQLLKNPSLCEIDEDYLLLSAEQKELFAYIEEHTQITLQEYIAHHPEKPIAGVKRDIAFLKDLTLIEKKGLGKSSYYVLRKKISTH